MVIVRHVRFPNSDVETSCLGMGCASLGSRISPSAGLRSLAAAFDAGIRWYDVAPAYGAGQAEEILGKFSVGRRSSLQICSKVGLAPPAQNRWIRYGYSVARPMAGVMSGLRRGFRKIPATRNVHIPLSAKLIEQSISNSLKSLNTDYLDCFALHDPCPEDVQREEIIRALENVLALGQAKRICVAGSLKANLVAAKAGAPYQILQVADDYQVNPLPLLIGKMNSSMGFITHSVLGISGALEGFVKTLAQNKAVIKDLADLGFTGGLDAIAVKLLVQRAFLSNPNGVVLFSMFSEKHLQENIAYSDLEMDKEIMDILKRILPSAPVQATN